MNATPRMSLVDASQNARMLERIEALRPDAAPLWGKMDVARALVHCQRPLDVAMGRLELSRSLLGRLFGRMAKKSMVSPAPYKKGLPTDPRLLTDRTDGFEVERQRLVQRVREFGASGLAGITERPHPFFGPMTREEWDGLMWKHLDHHLRQFAV